MQTVREESGVDLRLRGVGNVNSRLLEFSKCEAIKI